MKLTRFPNGFYFGASTSSHQVEGGCLNDWTEWERLNADRLAGESAKYESLPSWNAIKKQALNPDNYISGTAADHYNRYPEDIALAKKIGLNAYRFSIEWSRVEPGNGVWDRKELEHYTGMIDFLLKKNIEPFVTVWHWTLPLWLSGEGGAANPDFPIIFARYAAKLAQEFSGKVRFIILINEPEIYTLNSYLRGIWPPQKKSPAQYLRVMNNLITAHRLAYKEIKKIAPGSLAGTACNMSYFEGRGINRIAVNLADRFWNRYFTDRVRGFMDFAGLNYYMHNRIHYGFNRNENRKVSDMGWELLPDGILPVLLNLKKYGLPVYITENGLADADDENRSWFIEETLRSVLTSINKGVDVKGYFHWSLLDNFEWDKGFWPRFGLISVNRGNMSRKIRKSAGTYRQIIQKGLKI